MTKLKQEYFDLAACCPATRIRGAKKSVTCVPMISLQLRILRQTSQGENMPGSDYADVNRVQRRLCGTSTVLNVNEVEWQSCLLRVVMATRNCDHVCYSVVG